MNFVLNIFSMGVAFIFKAILYFCLGIYQMLFSSIEKKKNFVILFVFVWLDINLVYPNYFNTWLHLILLMLPFVYVVLIGRNSTV
jgi:hypothetical protein